LVVGSFEALVSKTSIKFNPLKNKTQMSKYRTSCMAEEFDQPEEEASSIWQRFDRTMC
jgi:hypothetical protein